MIENNGFADTIYAEHEEFQNELEKFEIENNQLDKLIDALLDKLNTIKMQQYLRNKQRLEIDTGLQTEIKKNEIYDLDLARLAKQYVELTGEIDLLRIKEVNKLKEALIQILSTYDQLEDTIQKYAVNTTMEQVEELQKSINVDPDKIKKTMDDLKELWEKINKRKEKNEEPAKIEEIKPKEEPEGESTDEKFVRIAKKYNATKQITNDSETRIKLAMIKMDVLKLTKNKKEMEIYKKMFENWTGEKI